MKLLSLLQAHREWSGTELAQRLEIDVRTVRRDITKLRALGYPVNAAPGVAGGYQLAAGAQMPPLLLDDATALTIIATAARDRQRIRFEYRAHNGTESIRNPCPGRA